MGVLIIMVLNIAGKEGFIDEANEKSRVHFWLQNFGLKKNLSLISIFEIKFDNLYPSKS